MKFWTILIAFYVIDGENVESRVLFPDEASCSRAIAPMKKLLEQTYPDVAVGCRRTSIISASIRPKARPLQ